MGYCQFSSASMFTGRMLDCAINIIMGNWDTICKALLRLKFNLDEMNHLLSNWVS